jgi:hypothetical protein
VPNEVTASLALSDKEMEQVRRVAKQKGITTDEAATLLFSAGLARRVKKRTGKSPAKVYSLSRQK